MNRYWELHDGTGLGDDRNIWGGEFFKYKKKEMQRCCHFDYFPVIAGDKMAIEPRISAICTTAGIGPYTEIIKEKFTESEWHNYQLLINTTSLFSSSVGRIFDAVASMLGICDIQTYEGEAAMYLQVSAEDYVEENGFIMDDNYFSNDAAFCNVPTASLMQGIITDIETGKSKNFIAAKFHYSLVWLIGAVAEYMGIKKICFSGGVFQNGLLVDWIQKLHGNKYQIYFHKDLSPNDENISFGQLVYFDNDINKKIRGQMVGSSIIENLKSSNKIKKKLLKHLDR